MKTSIIPEHKHRPAGSDRAVFVQSAAAAAVVVIIAAATAAVAVAHDHKQNNQNDDPPAVAIVTAHKNSPFRMKNGSMIFMPIGDTVSGAPCRKRFRFPMS